MSFIDLAAVCIVTGVVWHLGYLWLNPTYKKGRAQQASLAAALAEHEAKTEKAFQDCDVAFQAMQKQVFEQVNALRQKVNAEALNGERVPNTLQPGRRIF